MSVQELEKFTRFFIQKAIQVVVQSRLGMDKIYSKSNPEGKDMFNLSITDLKEVSDATTKAFELIANQSEDKKMSVKKEFSICCEISLKSDEGETMVLESWFINNDMIPIEEQVRSVQEETNYNVYNRMTLLLKSLTCLTRASPAYKLSQSGQSADTFVICYRIYPVKPGKSSPTSSPTQDKSKRFSKTYKLGSILSQYNCLSISFVYRTSLSRTEEDDVTETTAVKEDGSSSHRLSSVSNQETSLTTRNFSDEAEDGMMTKSRRIAAFADNSTSPSKSNEDTNLLLIPENGFLSLLISPTAQDTQEGQDVPLEVVPEKESKEPEEEKDGKIGNLVSCEESFVFVEAPFASSEESKVLGSFFNGPTPAFSQEEEALLANLGDLSAEIEKLESSVPQWDSFVDSVCSQTDHLQESSSSGSGLNFKVFPGHQQESSSSSSKSAQITSSPYDN